MSSILQSSPLVFAEGTSDQVFIPGNVDYPGRLKDGLNDMWDVYRYDVIVRYDAM